MHANRSDFLSDLQSIFCCFILIEKFITTNCQIPEMGCYECVYDSSFCGNNLKAIKIRISVQDDHDSLTIWPTSGNHNSSSSWSKNVDHDHGQISNLTVVKCPKF